MPFSSKKSIASFSKACSLIPGGVNSPVRAFKSVGGTPVFFKKAKGAEVWDEDGNRYVDFCQSWGPLILGHAHPRVVEAVCESASAGLSYGACHKRETDLAELILSGCPGFDMVRLVNSGTEAVMTALRVARGATGRDLVVKFAGGYHGHSDALLVKAGSGLATSGVADSAGIPDSVAATTIVANFDDNEGLERLFERQGDSIAAAIIEPLPANNGLLVQRKEFLERLRELTHMHGAMLIFDEVISGFRLHFGGYYAILGIMPDIVTLGKIIGGGMPVGAVVGSRAVMRLLAPEGPVYQAGTLSGNPVSLAAGIATLNVLKNDEPYGALERLGARFITLLNESGLPNATAVRIGSIIWPYFDNGEKPRRPDRISPKAIKRYNAIFWKMLEAGYYLPPSAYEVWFLSAAHTSDHIDGLAGTLVECLKNT
ncbi:MAG: glutamate-1-semialdehyde 2,1-aminomutase [Chitinivibrionales bacterium]